MIYKVIEASNGRGRAVIYKLTRKYATSMIRAFSGYSAVW